MIVVEARPALITQNDELRKSEMRIPTCPRANQPLQTTRESGFYTSIHG